MQYCWNRRNGHHTAGGLRAQNLLFYFYLFHVQWSLFKSRQLVEAYLSTKSVFYYYELLNRLEASNRDIAISRSYDTCYNREIDHSSTLIKLSNVNSTMDYYNYSCAPGLTSLVTANAIESQLFKPKTLVDVPGLGKIQGTTQRTYLTRKEYPAFTNIPYGKILRRFRPAELVTQLTASELDVFDATQAQAPCIQAPNPIVPNSGNGGVENCLTLNVFTPRVKGVLPPYLEKPLPVIVFLHGGSFIRWSGNMWDGRRLLERDVILVTVNYRLGALGYLCLGTDDAPGNAGLYDQILALKWVQRYISSFGGDPSRVTISGQSAGAASVSWLLDSELAKGLFRSAIALSGADIAGWAIQPNPIPNGLNGAKSLGCLIYQTDANGQPTTTPDVKATVDCLSTLPASSLNLDASIFYPAPCIQNFNLTIPKTSPISPAESLAKGLQDPVPLIIGTTKNDASFLVSRLYSGTIAPNGLESNPTFLKNDLLPSLFRSWGFTDNPPGYFNQLATTYLGAAKDSGNLTAMLPGIIDLYSTFFFKKPAFTIANYHAGLNSNTYLYSFDYFGALTYYPYTGGVPQVPRGVTHVDDLMYLFNVGEFTRVEDYVISLFMVDSWVNFASTSDPNKRNENDTPLFNNWPKYNMETGEFIKINVVPTEGNNYEAYWVGASTGIKG